MRKEIILNLIANKPDITSDEIAHILNLTRRTILRDIGELKKENRIKRIEGRKDGYWAIQKDLDL
jgi:ATP-dependent DNA helicase RecG